MNKIRVSPRILSLDTDKLFKSDNDTITLKSEFNKIDQRLRDGTDIEKIIHPFYTALKDYEPGAMTENLEKVGGAFETPRDEDEIPSQEIKTAMDKFNDMITLIFSLYNENDVAQEKNRYLSNTELKFLKQETGERSDFQKNLYLVWKENKCVPKSLGLRVKKTKKQKTTELAETIADLPAKTVEAVAEVVAEHIEELPTKVVEAAIEVALEHPEELPAPIVEKLEETTQTSEIPVKTVEAVVEVALDHAEELPAKAVESVVEVALDHAEELPAKALEVISEALESPVDPIADSDKPTCPIPGIYEPKATPKKIKEVKEKEKKKKKAVKISPENDSDLPSCSIPGIYREKKLISNPN